MTWYILGALAFVALLPALVMRVQLSRAKHRSLVGHANLSRHIARHIPFYEYSAERFFRVDDAPDEVVAVRRRV